MSDILISFAPTSPITVSMFGANLTAGVVSLAGTAGEITVSASTGAVTLSLPSALVFTGKTITGGTFSSTTLTAPDINGGTVDSLTSLSVRSIGAAFDLTFATTEVITAGRTLSWNVGNADRTITLSGNPTLNDWFDQSVKSGASPTFTATNFTGFPTLNQNTTGSAASLSISGQTGLVTLTGLASTNRIKTVRDAADTILELGGSYTPTGTWTSLTLVTPALGTPTSGVVTNLTGTASININGTVGATTPTTGVFTTMSATTGAAVGGATAGTGGVAFPATAVAVANANTLDDYEEGTWTPSVGGNATYTTQLARYTKIGRVVTIFGRLTINVLGTGSANTISGLPFSAEAAVGSFPIYVGYWAGLAVTPVFVGGYTAGGTTIVLQGITAAGANMGTLSALGNGADIMFACTYNIA